MVFPGLGKDVGLHVEVYALRRKTSHVCAELTTSLPPSTSSSTSADGPLDVSVETLRSSRRNPDKLRDGFPMTPQYAIRELGHKLSDFEKKEIMEYPDVWYLGIDAKKVEGVAGGPQNSGQYSTIFP